MYTREWTARFSHVDMFRFVFYPELVRIVHDTAEEYLLTAGHSFRSLQDDFGIGFPLVQFNADFAAPIRADDTVTISVTHEIGTTSLRFEFEGVHLDGTPAFSAFEQRVCVPVDEAKPVPVPDQLRADLDATDTTDAD